MRTFQTFLKPVKFDVPHHEDDGRDDREDEGVGKVAVESELHHVPPEPEGPCRGHQGRKHPPTNRAESTK